MLREYSWPGNVRELENLVRNLTCVHPGKVIEASQLPLLEEVGGPRPVGSFQRAKSSLIAEFERRYLEDALSASGGNIARAGLADKVEVRIGPAIDSLKAMVAAGEQAYDLVFIDADKQSNADYAQVALDLTRPGSAIIVDNVVREGRVLDPAGDAMVQGTRRLFDYLQVEERLDCTAVQTVGAKKWDGFVLALVKG